MGNRAAITVEPYTEGEPCIYLHWNGSPEHVEAILVKACTQGTRDNSDPTYCLAGIMKAAIEYCDYNGETGLGIGRTGFVDDGDNGTYVIGKGLMIVERRYDGEVMYARRIRTGYNEAKKKSPRIIDNLKEDHSS